MNAPSLQRLAVLSFFFHITLFAAGFWAASKQSTPFVMPSPYIVNLVASDVTTQESAAPAVKQTEGQVSVKETDVVPPQKEVKKLTRKEDQKLKERIAALESKKKAIKIAELRNKMGKITSSKGSGTGGKGVASARATGKGKGLAGNNSTADNYISGVTNKIQGQFEVTEELKKKNLEAIVLIRIMKNGSLQINKFEKRSGNSLFDRSAQKAIIKASPVTPPPYEMDDIGVRFHGEE